MNSNQSPTQTTTKSNNRKLLLVFLVVASIAIVTALGLLILSFFGIFTYERSGNLTNSNNSINNAINTSANLNSSEETDNTTAPPATLNRVFVGTYVTATIPQEWSIVEYTDEMGFVDGMTIDGALFGLTGLEIKDENNQTIFSLQGIDGIGGNGACTSVGQFKDTETSYVQNVKDTNDLVGSEPPTVINLMNVEYTEINALGLRMRRVDNKMYLAETFSIAFNTECGISEKIVRIDELGFTVDNDYEVDAYRLEINPEVLLESTLEQLDEVLQTLKAKSAS